MRRTIKSTIMLAALAVTPLAWAGIIFIPVGGVYQDLEMALVEVRATGNASADIGKPTGVLSGGLNGHAVKIRTSGLQGELTISGADLPPELGIIPDTQVVLELQQQLELVIDVAEGTVSGRSTLDIKGVYDASSPYIAVVADVQGSASCFPFNGQDCGQIVVDLELRGGLADAADPASVGNLQWQMLGSLVRDGQGGRWSALDARGTIRANTGLIQYILTNNEPIP